MEMRNTIDIAAPAATIYGFAAMTERWPEFLPHYRSVRVLEARGAEKLVAMAAWRDLIPISWTARQTDDPVTPRIDFVHVAGWTRGMDVTWHFTPIPGGTRVTIDHRLQFAFPVAAEFLGERVVGGYFVHDVASKTLRRMKELAEAHERAVR
jgi:ribosome-associated toxin RatA of RatAB toxin-antitoxin module